MTTTTRLSRTQRRALQYKLAREKGIVEPGLGGPWGATVESLIRRGYLERLAPYTNSTLTPAGRAIAEAK